LKADAFFMMYKYNEAISLYNSALTLEKDSKSKMNELTLADLYDHFGESYFRLANYSVALLNFKNAVKYNKNSGEIYFNLGKAYLLTNEIKDAESNLALALQREPRNPLWNYNLGLVYLKKEEYKQAVLRFTYAISLDSIKILAHDPVYFRGVCLTHENNFDDALKDYKVIEANKEESRYPEYYNELGIILLNKKLWPGAERCFHRSLAKDSTDAQAEYGMAIVFVQQKQMDEAMIWFEKSFSSGKIRKKRVTNDPLLNDIKEDKQFKKLIKQYL